MADKMFRAAWWTGTHYTKGTFFAPSASMVYASIVKSGGTQIVIEEWTDNGYV